MPVMKPAPQPRAQRLAAWIARTGNTMGRNFKADLGRELGAYDPRTVEGFLGMMAMFVPGPKGGRFQVTNKDVPSVAQMAPRRRDPDPVSPRRVEVDARVLQQRQELAELLNRLARLDINRRGGR